MKLFLLTAVISMLSLSCMEADTGAIEERVGILETEMGDVKAELASLVPDTPEEPVDAAPIDDTTPKAESEDAATITDPRNPAVMSNSRDIAALTGEVTFLQAQNDSLDTKLEALESVNESLQDDLESLEGELDDLRAIVQSIGARPSGNSSGGRGDSGRDSGR